MTTTTIVRTGTNGNDTFDLVNSLAYDQSGNLATFVYGLGGDDAITSQLSFANSNEGSTLTNLLDGGAGNDRIVASNYLASTYGSSISNITIAGGAGNDDLRSYSYGGPATNSTFTYVGFTGNTAITGGDGADRITAQTDDYFRLDFGDHTEPVFASNTSVTHTLNGGAGDDTIDSLIRAGTAFASLSAALVGGQGNDVLNAQVVVDNYLMFFNYGYAGSSPVNQVLDGQEGNDRLTAGIAINYADFSSSLHNTLSGGNGNDALDADIHVARYDASYDGSSMPPIAINKLSGGAGDDVLVAHITFDAVVQTDPITLDLIPSAALPGAFSTLEGGQGNDTLIVFGGNGNQLFGGAGNDVLVGGIGQDTFTGGMGADRFVFDRTGSNPSSPDLITDFSAAQGDRLDFSAMGVAYPDLVITHGVGNSYDVAIDFDHNGSIDFDLKVASAQPLTSGAFIF